MKFYHLGTTNWDKIKVGEIFMLQDSLVNNFKEVCYKESERSFRVIANDWSYWWIAYSFDVGYYYYHYLNWKFYKLPKAVQRLWLD